MVSDEERSIIDNYDVFAQEYAASRLTGTGSNGLQNRELERPTMFSLLPLDLSGLSLVDVGCGPGIHAHEYQKRGASVVAVDPSKELLAIAKKTFPTVDFRLASAYEIPLTDNSCDVVTCSLVLDHVKDVSKVVSEFSRVLKIGGSVLFSVPHPVTYMFRDSPRADLVISHSYFDRSSLRLNITHTEKTFIDYPRTIQDYLDVFMKKGFVLERFIEGELDESLKEKYPAFPKSLFLIPPHMFFKFKKGDSV